MLSDPTIHEDMQHKPLFVIDLRILTKVLVKKFKLLVLITFIAMLITAAWTFFNVSPSWKANCYVIRAPKNMSTPAEMPYLYQSFDINTVLETVRTRDVLSDVIKKLELSLTPEELFRHIDVQRGNRSHVLRFSASWNDPDIAATIANATAESFILNNNRLQNSATLNIYNYYLEQQKIRLANIDNLSHQFEAHRAKYGVISIPHETTNKFDQLREIELEMVKNSLLITEMDSKIAEMESKIEKAPEEVVMTWTFTQTDKQRLLDLEKELELLLSRYTPENPKVMKIQSEIDELRALMERSQRDIPQMVTWGPNAMIEYYTVDKSRYEAEREGAFEKNEQFQQKVDEIKATLQNLTQLEKEFFEIERQLELNKDILKMVEGRMAEAKMAMQSNVSDFEIIEKAKAPDFPEGGRRKLIVLLAGIIVFIGGLSYLVAREIFSSHTKSPKDFSDVIKIPLIGCLPDETEVDKHVFYRNLQVMLDDILRSTANVVSPVITLGSDVAEAGISFIVKEIIHILRQKPQRILYIDCVNQSNPDIDAYLINEYLYGHTESFNLDTRNPQVAYAYFVTDDDSFTTIIEPQRVHQFLALQTQFDLILWELFDFPFNIQLFSNISSMSTLLLLVARFDHSGRNSLARLVDFLREKGFTNVHGVLNYVPKDYFQDRY